jgi:hypothetical protein
VDEHVQALVDGGFDGPVNVTLVGAAEQRETARAVFLAEIPHAAFTELDEGWEGNTLQAARAHARGHRDDAILYCHSHGTWQPTPGHDLRRRRANDELVRRWRDCADQLSHAGGDTIVGWGDAGFFIAPSRCWARAEPLSASTSPAAFGDWCMWTGHGDRAAADMFLLGELERWGRRMHSVTRHLHAVGMMAVIPVAEWPEAILVESVEITRASWPTWKLSGDEGQPILDRLDEHFNPVALASGDWQGARPYGTYVVPRAEVAA